MTSSPADRPNRGAAPRDEPRATRPATRAVLLTPISPQVRGNGLAQRSAMWTEVLAGARPPVVVVAPVAGPAGDTGDEHVLVASRRDPAAVPALARGIDRRAGRAAGVQLLEAGDLHAAEVIVCLRSYLGRAALGLRDVLGGALVVDLDDDDVAYFAAAGLPDEADRFARLIDALRAETDLFVSAGGVAGTVIVPNSVPVPPARARRASSPMVTMVGNMGYGPNRDGAEWFLRSVLPTIHAAVPEVSTRIVGPGSEALGPDGVGFVDDLAEVYDTSAVVVAPVLLGSGTRTKIIEAWAHGAPVVSTTIGAEGLGGIADEHLLLADDAPAFAAAVVSLLSDPARAARMGRNGRWLAEARYARDRVVDDAQAVLRDLRPDLVLTPAAELHVVETDEGFVVLDIPSGDVHDLDTNASAVFSLIDGDADLDEIASTIAGAFGLAEPPVEAVADAAHALLVAGVVVRTRRAAT